MKENKFLIAKKEVNNFLKKNKKINTSKKNNTEFFIERLKKWDNKKIKETILWFKKIIKENKATIKKKKLSNLVGWEKKLQNDSYSHKSGYFFKVEGYEIKNSNNREVKSWDQPFIREVGHKGGIIGLIKKNIKGIPHYLVQAKFEPGNFGGVQLSPSMQSTFSNLNQKHNGKSNDFIKLFNRKSTIKKKWINEDGGRFMKKRNLHWIIKINKNFRVKKNFKWLTLWDIIYLSNKTNIVNCHLRSIITLL